ncbi:DUF4347 domain-containing protein, partial [Rhodocista pekingensis]
MTSTTHTLGTSINGQADATGQTASPPPTTGGGGRKEVVFIDGGIDGLADLLASVRDGGEVVVLDGTGDGLAQMAAWAADGHAGYDAIHLVTHGAAGRLHLGALSLDGAVAAERADDLARLGSALSDDGDLLLYGCDVADGAGTDFVRQLSTLTGADVAASTDRTGAAALGGNWTLERSVGSVETPTAFDRTGGFSGVLDEATHTVKESTSYTLTNGTIDYIALTGSKLGSIYGWLPDNAGINNIAIVYGFNPEEDFIDLRSLTFLLDEADYTTDVVDDSTGIYMYGTDDRFTTYTSWVSPITSLPEPNPNYDKPWVLDADHYSVTFGTTATGIVAGVQNANEMAVYYVYLVGVSAVDSSCFLLPTSPTAPTLDLNGAAAGTRNSITWTEDGGVANGTAGSGPVAIAPAATVTDGGNIQSMTVSIGNAQSGDSLTLTGSYSGITISGSGTTSITLTGPSDTASFQSALQAVTFNNSSDAPNTTARTININAKDADGESAAQQKVTVTLTAVNDAPVITSDGGGATATVTVAENTTAVTTVVATDADGDTLSYSITGGADKSLFSIDSSTGVLSFASGHDFESPADSGGDNTYTVVVTASDGTVSDTQTVNVSVTDVDEAPTLTATGATPTFTEGGSAVALFSGATASAVDAGQTLTGLTLTVSNVSTGDVLSIGGTACVVDGGGTWSVGGGTDNAMVVVSGGTATVTITGLSLSATDFQTLVTGITFSSGSDNPDRTARVVTITGLTDSGASDNSTSLNLTSTVSVVGQPDVTSVTLPPNGTYKIGDNLTFTVNFDQAVTVDTSGGTPRIALTVGSTTTYAEYVSGSGSAALAFSYTVGTGDADADGIAVSAGAIDPAGGTLTGTTGSVNADPDLGTIGSLAGVKVDGVRPTITGVSIPDQTHKIGDAITVTINAGEAGLSLHGGSLNGIALTDLQDKGDGTYTATYTVSEGDSDRAAGADIPVEIVLKDAAGNISDAWTTPISQSNDAIDATAPAAPTLGFTDTGVSDSDGITTDTTLEIGNLEPGASWQYRLDDKGSWSAGSGTSLTLAEGVYANGSAVQVRQIDAAGNAGAVQTMSVTIDTTKPIVTTGRDTPADPLTNADELIYSVSFDEDMVNVDASDFTVLGTAGDVGTPTLTVTAIDARTYTVKVSGGNIATYNGDLYLSLAQVRDLSDIAGNVPDVGSGNYAEYTLDNTVPTTPTLALASDTG